MAAQPAHGGAASPKRTRLAVVNYAYGETEPPPELLEATLCEFFHCLPSALEREDAGQLLRYAELMGLYRAAQAMQDGIATAAQRKIVGQVLMTEFEDAG